MPLPLVIYVGGIGRRRNRALLESFRQTFNDLLQRLGHAAETGDPDFNRLNAEVTAKYRLPEGAGLETAVSIRTLFSCPNP